ncbi:hypothetical protein Tco_1192341 [Tanacetum coccineum]
MRIASHNQLSESDVQQVVRFNNGLRYDIQAIVSLQTTWTIDEVVRKALKAEQTIKKQGTSSSMYKTKTDTNQSSRSSENIISRDIVTRLKLTPKKHPEPYKIGWIKAVGEEDLGTVDNRGIFEQGGSPAGIHGLFNGRYCGLAGRMVTLRVSTAGAKGVTTRTLVSIVEDKKEVEEWLERP